MLAKTKLVLVFVGLFLVALAAELALYFKKNGDDT